jgi:hypothetical protein
MAAAMAASRSVPASAVTNVCPVRSASTRSRYIVVKSPAMNSGWSISQRKNGTVVRTPTTRYSSITRRSRAIASPRVSPQTTSFEISES